MIKEGAFGMFEAVCLTTLFIITKVFYVNPSILAKLVGTASWYMMLFSAVISLLFFQFVYILVKRFPGKDLVGIFEAVLGKGGAIFLGILFITYYIFYAGSELREFVEMIKAYTLPYTLPSVIIGSIILVAVLSAYYGIESLARISALLFIPILIGLAANLLLASPSYDLTLLRPWLGYGLDKSIYYGFFRSSSYGEVLILAFFINSVHGAKSFKKAGIISILISAVTLGISNFCYIITFGYAAAKENLSGMYELSRSIYFNRFFQRVESIFLFIWTISSVIAVSIAFYLALSIFCKTFKLNNHRPLMFPMASLVFMAAMLPNNLSEVVNINILLIRQYSLFLLYLVPLLVLIVSLVLNRKGDGLNAQKG